MNFFKTNLDLLFSVNDNVSREDIDFADVESKISLSSFEKDMKEWRDPSNLKVVKLPSYAPTSEPIARGWNTTYEKYRNVESLSPYIDLHDDPHTCLFTSDLFLKQLELNIDPNDDVINAVRPVQGLVCLGTGNGELLKFMLENFAPYNLIVLVNRWEDLICSFHNLDWNSIYSYFNSTNHRILIGKTNDDPFQSLTYLSSFGIISIDNMLIYSPSSSDDDLLDIKPSLTGRQAQNLILYQGYTIDEYNMIYNSARFFLKKPKLYSRPISQIANSVIVVGSGPSLDHSIEFLKEYKDSHVIICGGSNYRTLMKNGIVPDFLVLVERADEVYDSYKLMYDEFGKSTTKLVVSSTCSDRLAELYDDVCLFYRPALTPLVVFGEGNHQKIAYEGPQAVCAAFSFAMNFQPSTILLVGVDFGSSNKSLQRSADAVGYSPHSWSDETIGNFGGQVFTDRRLLDCRDVLALCLKSFSDQDTPTIVYNSSDGVLIEGTVPISISEYISCIADTKFTSIVEDWWSSLSYVDLERMRTIVNSRRPREETLKLINELRTLFSRDNIPWFPTLVASVESLLELNLRSPTHQVPIRIVKSTIMKAVLTISQRFHILNKSPKNLEDRLLFGSYAKSRLVELCDQLEKEVYLLFDSVDDILSGAAQ